MLTNKDFVNKELSIVNLDSMQVMNNVCHVVLAVHIVPVPQIVLVAIHPLEHLGCTSATDNAYHVLQDVFIVKVQQYALLVLIQV